ncbi:hypothetical protein EW146_g5152 [Bondarzewia mesenterica]|uniref:F-box domain-containing protein n=1 Tax=Bondarzewia mesenterica TaxID=1095465 RepID=A0A4S4LSB2_9AGAM|nr:hypothetical protein EW146_g5152 [Bondarzewia mesenterica]
MTGPNNFVYLCVARSKSAPLHLIDFTDRDWELLTHESHRLVSLSFSSLSFYVPTLHAPQLEYLIINLPYLRSKSSKVLRSESELPRLRRLWLCGPCTCSVRRFPSLTHLVLSNREGLSLGTLLDFLRENVMLETLVLDYTHPTLDRASKPCPVYLPRLQHFVMIEELYGRTVQDVVSRISFPPTTTALFDLHCHTGALRPIFLVESYPRPCMLTDDTTISFVAWGQAAWSVFIYNRTYRFKISQNVVYPSPNHFSLPHSISSLHFYIPVVDMTHIRELSIEIASEAREWRPCFFPEISALRKLTVSANTAEDCLHCFAAIRRGELPELKTLCVHLREISGHLVLFPLYRLVRQRKQEGRPLTDVFIRDERLKHPKRFKIDKYVDILEVDSTPSPFRNSSTGCVLADVPDALTRWNWWDEFD